MNLWPDDMASKKRSAKKTAGPHLAAAFFCQSTIEDKDGTLSAIRIVDQFNFIDKVSVNIERLSKELGAGIKE